MKKPKILAVDKDSLAAPILMGNSVNSKGADGYVDGGNEMSET